MVRSHAQVPKAMALRALLAASLLGGVAAADAAAATGDLTQKAGLSGCISESGAGPCVDGMALAGATSPAVSPDGKNVYVASTTSDAVAVFDRAAGEQLTQKPAARGCISDTGARCADGTALDDPAAVAVSPDGHSVYVASLASGAVAVFDRGKGGRMTQKRGAAGCVSDTGACRCADATALDDPTSLAVSPDGDSVYVTASGSDAVVMFDRARSGKLTQRRGAAGCVSQTAAGGCARGTMLDEASAVTVSPDGDSVYVAAFAGDGVAAFDRAADGKLSQKRGTAGCITGAGVVGCDAASPFDRPTSLVVSPDGDNVYVVSVDSATVTVLDRGADGSLTQRPGTAGCISDAQGEDCVDGRALGDPDAVTVSPDGASVYVASFAGALAVFDRVRSP